MYAMRCTTCDYRREYPKAWQAEASAHHHRADMPRHDVWHGLAGSEWVETVAINGILYHVIATLPLEAMASSPRALAEMQAQGVQRLVTLRRPLGIKEHIAKDYGPHPVYGDTSRYVLLS